MKVWTLYLFKRDYLVFKNQGFHVCRHENPTVKAGKNEANNYKKTK